MIYHDYLVNPVQQTRIMKPEEFEKYITLRNEQLANDTTTDHVTVRKVYESFYENHLHAIKPEMNRIWQKFIQPMVEHNSALAQFILDYGGAESDYFFPWLVTVATSPSAALEMAYGAGYDVNGNWCTNIPESDNIADFIHNVPTFVYQRERQLKMADLVSSVKGKVVDLGAGRMAWLRYHDFRSNSKILNIIAVDKDPTIIPEEIFNMVGVEYERTDILPWLKTTTEKDISLVMIGGVASYFPLQAFTEAVIKPAYGILKNKGALFFDLQLDCLQYEWTIKLFGWPAMQLAKTAEEAIAKVEKIRRYLWENGIKFNAEYSVDTPNANPSAVMIIFQKI